MNVALLHYAAPPIVGGVETVMGHQARLLAEAGHNVVLVAGRGAPLPGPIDFVGLPLLDSRHPRVLAVKAELDRASVSADFHALSAEIETDLLQRLAGYNVVLAHNVCSLHKNLALTAALHRLNGQPGFPRLILWHHDLAWSTDRYRGELHPGYPWELLRQDWPGVQQVAVSEARRAELASLLAVSPERIRVVPNGVDVPGLLKLGEQARALAGRLRLAERRPLLLLPVRLTPRKNIELALQVLAALRSRPGGAGVSFETASLLVTGPEGPHNPANADYRQRLMALRDELGLAGAAHFAVEQMADPLTDETLADLYRLADALILPSREEGFGIPLLEAAVARLPVFCADIEPLRALGGRDVVYFSPEADPSAVAALVAERLSADAAYHFGVRVRQDYAWEQVYRAHIEPLLENRATL